MHKKIMTFVFVLLSIGGCATAVPTKWENASITDPTEKAIRLDKDFRSCRDEITMLSMFDGGEPTFIPVPEASSYTVTGQVYNYGNTSSFYGTARPTPSFSSGFASGYNAGAAIGAAMNREKRKKTYIECMHKYGWFDAEKK